MNDKTKQTMVDALPCPFCGGAEGFYLVESSTFFWRILSCRQCGEGIEVRHRNHSDDPTSYSADWNAAAPYPAMLRKEIDTLRTQLAEAQREAVTLAQYLYNTFYSHEPDYASGKVKWEPCDTPAGVITQIDNMVAGVRAQLAEQEDMANVGRALMTAIKAYAPEGWHPNDCPSEIVGDLTVEVMELTAQLAEAQRDSERLDWMIEQCAYVVSDPDCCDGYWLNYVRPDGTVWTQATEHETPRAAIDAAKGEPS